jgi:hypothetical protein
MSGDTLTPTMSALGLRPPTALPLVEPELIEAHRSLLDRLRALTPRRALTSYQAVQVAERQAAALRRHLGYSRRAQLPTEALRDLPFVTVTYRVGFPTSGMATRTDLGWVIVIRSDEPDVRQRFSLAHEIKHLVDSPLMHHKTGPLAGGLYPSQPGRPAHDRVERVCDAFAAALLMPKTMVRRDWTTGMQSIPDLARRYGVSRPAMEYRLKSLGLLPPTPRCAISAPHHGGTS